jgi:hypothetical protein
LNASVTDLFCLPSGVCSVPAEVISRELRSFIAEYVRSLMTLELLLLLYANRQREWRAPELARELRVELPWAERELRELAKRGLVNVAATDPPTYRYGPQRPELDAVTAQLAAIYPQHRFSIIQILYAAPSEPLQSFADAFKLRKDPSDG